jgi:SpoVK/Ycf46/Vps4 family AAA+-type ATPase
LQEAAKMVQPSARREGFSSIPNVKWEDVGGLDIIRHEFDRYIVRRIKHPEYYEVIFHTRLFNALLLIKVNLWKQFRKNKISSSQTDFYIFVIVSII